jgi:hypothetical protein
LPFFFACGGLTIGGMTNASETIGVADLLSVVVEDAAFPLVRLVPTVGPEQRSGTRGPLHEPSGSRHSLRWEHTGHYVSRALLEELVALTHARCRLGGARVVVSQIPNTWTAVFQVPPGDLSVVVAALEALLVSDEQPLRDFLNQPPPLDHAGEARAPHGRQPG